MKRTLIVGAALVIAPALAFAADDTKKSGDKPSSGMSIQSDPLPALEKDEAGKASAQEKASPKAKKGAEGAAGAGGAAGGGGGPRGGGARTARRTPHARAAPH